MLRNRDSHLKKIVILLFLSIAPIVAYVSYVVITLLNDYNGRCGLLDAAWDCTRSEYVNYVLFSVWVFPAVFFYSVAWLFILLVAALLVRTYRKKRRATT